MSRRILRHTLIVGTLVVTVAACGDSDDAPDEAGAATTTPDSTTATDTVSPDTTGAPAGEIPDGPTIVIGAQDFGESAILAELYGQALSAAGYPVEQQSLGGFRDLVYTTFESGDISFTIEYAASALEFLNGFAGVASGDIDETADALRDELEAIGLVAYDASPAVDSNSFVVTQATADSLAAPTVSSLTEDLRLGGPTDCPENASCLPGLIDTYGIDLSENFVPLDGGGPLTVAALEGGEIDVAILFSTNGIIADKGWVVLEDDEGMINADNIIPVLTQEVDEAYGDQFEDLIDAVSADLTTEALTELNRRYDIDKEDADAVAADWLAEHGFGG